MVASGGTTTALPTLTVSSSILEKDLLLQVVLQSANSVLQVSVTKPTKGGVGGGDDLSLSVDGGHTTVLKQRQAILRAIVGPSLHYALDQKLMGGHASNASPKSKIALASLQGWMSTAELNFAELDKHLERHAFLIPSSSCTSADYHVGILLLQNYKEQHASLASFPNLSRWLRTCHSQLKDVLGEKAAMVPPLPAAAALKPVLPIFYTGMEDVNAILNASAGKGGKPQVAAAAQQQGNNKKNKKQEKKQGGDGGGSGGGGDGKKNQQQGETSKKQQQNASGGGGGGGAAADVTISAMDLRVGLITKVWHHEEADKLFCEEIDLGGDIGTRQVASGLREHYKAEDLENRKVVVLCNLKKRNLVNFPSHGMVLCAVNSDRSQVKLVEPPADSKPGDKVVFKGHESGEPEPENKVAKKKIWEKLAPDLKTNDAGDVVWKDAIGTTEAGVVKGIPNAQVS